MPTMNWPGGKRLGTPARLRSPPQNARSNADQLRHSERRLTTISINRPLWQPFAPPDHVPDRQWLIEPWLPLGRLSMLASAGGGGKSTLALQLALAVTGEHGVWLPHAPPAAAEDEGMLGIQTAVDRTAVVRRPVVYASYEDELSEVYRRYHHIRATPCQARRGRAGSWRPVALCRLGAGP